MNDIKKQILFITLTIVTCVTIFNGSTLLSDTVEPLRSSQRHSILSSKYADERNKNLIKTIPTGTTRGLFELGEFDVPEMTDKEIKEYIKAKALKENYKKKLIKTTGKMYD